MRLPVIDALEPVMGVGIGALVFHETLAASVPALTGQLAAGAAAIVEVVLLDSYAAAGFVWASPRQADW